MSDRPTDRTEQVQRFLEQALQKVNDQKAMIERLKAEEHLNLIKPAEDYLDVLMETLEEAREHLRAVSAAEPSQDT